MGIAAMRTPLALCLLGCLTKELNREGKKRNEAKKKQGKKIKVTEGCGSPGKGSQKKKEKKKDSLEPNETKAFTSASQANRERGWERTKVSCTSTKHTSQKTEMSPSAIAPRTLEQLEREENKIAVATTCR
jgi:hypothetical protein